MLNKIKKFAAKIFNLPEDKECCHKITVYNSPIPKNKELPCSNLRCTECRQKREFQKFEFQKFAPIKAQWEDTTFPTNVVDFRDFFLYYITNKTFRDIMNEKIDIEQVVNQFGNNIKKVNTEDAGLVVYLHQCGWNFKNEKIISKHGGVTLENYRAAAAFQDYLNAYNRNVEKNDITELIQMRAKTPEIWEAAIWEKYTEECLNRATEELAEEIIDK